MFLVGSDDGVYRVPNATDPVAADATRVLDSERVLRLRTFDALPGVFAATKTGLYHAPDGESWTALDVPQDAVYAVAASPDGTRLYAGTRPAHVYEAVVPADGDLQSGVDWRDLNGFRRLADRDDWGIERHDDVAQVRSIQRTRDEPDRLIVGVEVGGVYVSDDAGQTWSDRRITGFDAPHTDDIHHVALEDAETMLAATGSGLYRTTDTGRTWHRLDAGRPQTYFREVAVHDGRRFAGGSPTSPRYWTENRDHALFECQDGETLDPASTPVPDEVAVGWTKLDGAFVTATNLGTVLRRDPDGWTEDDDNRTENHDNWTELGTVPVAESVHGRCIPMTWLPGE